MVLFALGAGIAEIAIFTVQIVGTAGITGGAFFVTAVISAVDICLLANTIGIFATIGNCYTIYTLVGFGTV